MTERELVALMSAILCSADIDNENDVEGPDHYVGAALDLLATVDGYLGIEPHKAAKVGED